MAQAKKDYRFKTQYYTPLRSANESNKPDKPKKKRRRLVKVAALLIILIVAFGIYVASAHPGLTKRVKNSISSDVNKVTSATAVTGSDSTSLAAMSQTINSVISDDSGIDISVNLIDLSNSRSEHYGVNETFQAASTAKIITAEYFLHEVEEGKQSLSETVGGYSAEYELQQMIVVSDDTAWANLNNLLGYDNLQNYADTTFNISDYQAYNNSLSSEDIAIALHKLWDGSILNSSDRALLLSYLKEANYREYIVPAIPSQDTIYHKIGLYEDYVNDAAIVTNGNKAFVIVIFTNGNGAYDWPARATMMQEITRAALKAYFNQGS